MSNRTPNEYTRSNESDGYGSARASAWAIAARPPTVLTNVREMWQCLLVRSQPYVAALASANCDRSAPCPHPTSRTRLPAHVLKSTNSGMNGYNP